MLLHALNQELETKPLSQDTTEATVQKVLLGYKNFSKLQL